MSHSILKKVAIIFGFFAFLMILDACYPDPDCDCPPVEDFFDFSEVIATSEIAQISGDTPFVFRLRPNDITYLSQVKTPCRSSWFSTTMYGCSCLWDGHEGMKISDYCFPFSERCGLF